MDKDRTDRGAGGGPDGHAGSKPKWQDLERLPVVGNLREEWHWVKKGIEEIIRLDPYVTYIPEDVYHSIKSGESTLWVHPDIFTVTSITTDVFNEERTLTIWLAWAKKRGTKNAAYHMPFYEEVARRANCATVEVRSIQTPVVDFFTRDLGYEISDITLSKRLGD